MNYQLQRKNQNLPQKLLKLAEIEIKSSISCQFSASSIFKLEIPFSNSHHSQKIISKFFIWFSTLDQVEFPCFQNIHLLKENILLKDHIQN